MEHILTVTELTQLIKDLLESRFGYVWVAGEVSNLRRPGSGHVYFTLKDEESQIRAVLFRPYASRIGFALEEGMSIVCRGRLSLYQPRGEYQIIVEAAEPRGLGALQMAFEQLKRRLEAEGLFAPEAKKAVPFLPDRIGIVTSPTGAAVRDILNITRRRFSSVNILIAPVRVQGMEAPPEICRAIEALNSLSDIDVIIVARGGGSLEDLYPFNDERVARAIFASRVPVISAVGHEIDFTIADFVADLRAPTPSAAAELVVPNRRDLVERLETLKARLLSGRRNMAARLRERVSYLQGKIPHPRRRIVDLRLLVDDRLSDLIETLRRDIGARGKEVSALRGLLLRSSPDRRVREYGKALDTTLRHLHVLLRVYLRELESRVLRNAALLDGLSPLAVLRRGYGIIRKMPDGTVIKDAASVAAGDLVSVKVALGGFDARVTEVKEEQENGGKEI